MQRLRRALGSFCPQGGRTSMVSGFFLGLLVPFAFDAVVVGPPLPICH